MHRAGAEITGRQPLQRKALRPQHGKEKNTEIKINRRINLARRSACIWRAGKGKGREWDRRTFEEGKSQTSAKTRGTGSETQGGKRRENRTPWPGSSAGEAKRKRKSAGQSEKKAHCLQRSQQVRPQGILRAPPSPKPCWRTRERLDQWGLNVSNGKPRLKQQTKAMGSHRGKMTEPTETWRLGGKAEIRLSSLVSSSALTTRITETEMHLKERRNPQRANSSDSNLVGEERELGEGIRDKETITNKRK